MAEVSRISLLVSNERLLPSLTEAEKHCLNQLADSLESISVVGCNVLPLLGSTPDVGDWAVPSLMMLRGLLQHTRAVAALLRTGLGESAMSSLRDSLERDLNIEYLLKVDQSKRGFLYLVWSQMEELRAVRRFDSASPQGREVDRRARASRFPMALVDGAVDISGWEARLNELHQEPGYRVARARYDEVLSAGVGRGSRRVAHWYTLVNDSLANLELLALELKRGPDYDLMYRTMSETSHAERDNLTRLVGHEDRMLVIPPLIALGNPFVTARMAAGFAMHSLDAFCRVFAPSRRDEFGAWRASFVAEFDKRCPLPHTRAAASAVPGVSQ